MKKNILIASYNLDFGGIETSLINLLKNINFDKYKVTLVLEKKEGVFLKDVPKEYKDVMASSIPMGRLGKDSEIANLICYLLSDEASFITGDIVSIDGGFTAA